MSNRTTTFIAGAPFSYSGRITTTVDPQGWQGFSQIRERTAERELIEDLYFEWLAASVDNGDGTYTRLMRVYFDADTSAWTSPNGQAIFDVKFKDANGDPILFTGRGVIEIEQPVTQL